MRPCTPITSAPAPRESAFKFPPHPAAPVGEPSQTRRHHLTPTLVVVGADALIGPLHQLPSTAKPAAAKREAIQCDDHPDEVGTIRHGTAVSIS